MMIHEVLGQTGLTRKAVEYYIEQGLVCPKTKENGYREFSEADIARLRMISVYRRLGISIVDMIPLLDGDERNAMRSLAARRSLAVQREQRRCEMLSALADGTSIEQIALQLDALKAQETIADRLLDAFPGYFGQYCSLHFSHFLAAPIKSKDQTDAYETIVRWLDQLPPLDLPEELLAFLHEAQANISAEQMEGMHDALLTLTEDPQAYLKAHEESIRTYLALKDTEEYRSSPAARLMQTMRNFQQHHGYEDVFIPAMERLSPEYAAYRSRMKGADKVFEKVFNVK